MTAPTPTPPPRRNWFTTARFWMPALLLVVLLALAVQTGEWIEAGVMAVVVLAIAGGIAWAAGNGDSSQ